MQKNTDRFQTVCDPPRCDIVGGRLSILETKVHLHRGFYYEVNEIPLYCTAQWLQGYHSVFVTSDAFTSMPFCWEYLISGIIPVFSMSLPKHACLDLSLYYFMTYGLINYC